MVKNKRDPYSCPCCGLLPNSIIYKDNSFEKKYAYKFENGLLKIPLERMVAFKCCEGEHLIPYHDNPAEYLDSIKDIISFHIGESWVDNYLYTNSIAQNR